MSLDNSENIYQVGGSLPVHASTYVRRSADENLYAGLLAGDFCYVLNSRQMGKSSLRVQTMKRLQETGVVCTVIDLTSIGSQDITPEQWYAGIIYSLASGLELLDKFNLGEWWQDRQFLAPLQRLGQFLSEIVLREIQGKIVIFIDEIDSVLSLSFNVDDFFGLIRSCYQKDSNYERLAFALFGVASPTDLIRNKNTNNNFSTPFNIGRAIDLEGFQLSEAMPLATGFRNIFEQPEEILRDILDWTGGQPFLTQKVCKLVLKYGQAYSENIVSNVVQQKIINNWEGQDEPEHLKTIRDRLLYSSKNKYKLLELYHRILQEGVINDQNLPAYTELRLTGLVVKQNAKLKVYNRIYAEVFNLEWLKDEFKSSGWIIPSNLGKSVNDPYLSTIYYSEGLDSYNNRDYHGAISNFEKVIKIDPLDIMAYNYRGRSYFKLGKYQEAINDYNQAITIDPDFALIYRNRGDVHCSLNNYEAAVADYNRAISLDPKDNIAHMGWAIAQKKLNNINLLTILQTNVNNTEKINNQVSNIAINDAEVHYCQGLEFYLINDYEQAIFNFDEAIKINPNYFEAYNNRGNVYYDLKEYEMAISEYNKAITIKPDNSLTYNKRGMAFQQLHDYRKAITDYDQAITIDTSYAEAYRNRAIARHYLEDYEGAISDYAIASKLDPNYTYNQEENLLISKNFENSKIKISNNKIIDTKLLKIFEFETVTVNNKGEIIKRENKQARYFTEILPNNITLDMVEIPGGSFIMGSPETEIGRYKDEGPQHEVTIKKFYIGKYPITQAQYEAVMNYNPSKFIGKNRPVEKVTWDKAVEFCKKLSEKIGKVYRLPSEAQWEYAARAGTKTTFHYGETITTDLANYDGNYTYAEEPQGKFREETTSVGIFPPNAFGLYDIHGNVWEWCEDSWHDNYDNAPNDGSSWVSNDKNYSRRGLRGGSWNYIPNYCRVANRHLNVHANFNYSIGFRVCCLIEENVNILVDSQEKSVKQLTIDPKYIRLEQLLANQQWKEADQETARVILKIAKREDEAFLNQEAINNFPCDDLNIIDELWLKYSNGLFGFSIQRNILLEYDGKLDDETLCKLGDRLGWRKEGIWLKYDEINFDIHNIYPGHLPWTMWGCFKVGETSYFALKLVSCNLSNTQNKNLVRSTSNHLIEQKKKLVTTRQNLLTEEGFLGDFSVNGKLVRIFQGDITNLVADVIVTFDNNYLTMRSPPSAKIRAIGGKEIYEEAQSLVRRFSIGDVIVTKAGRLPCKKIFHATVISYTDPAIPTSDIIRKLVDNCLKIATNSQFQSLAMPLLATGGYGFSRKMAWKIALQETIKHFSNSSPQYLQEVVIVIYRKEVVAHLNIENTLQRIAIQGWEYLLNETNQ